MPLTTYRKKRNFKITPEPSGDESAKKGTHLSFVVQKHIASHLHYDFRLEWKGVLLSWAVPKGPSLDPSIKRLAMRVEDHPIEYSHFEGVIPQGEYGAGTVMVWDKGTWQPDSPDVDAPLRKGELRFTLHGNKLNGAWLLLRARAYGSSKRHSSWLLIKQRDQYASSHEITIEQPGSILTQRLLADIARDAGGDVEKAASGDLAAATVAGSSSQRRLPKFRSRADRQLKG